MKDMTISEIEEKAKQEFNKRGLINNDEWKAMWVTGYIVGFAQGSKETTKILLK